MPRGRKAQNLPPGTRGTVDACACPWCRKANSFKNVEDYALEQYQDFKCDYCGRVYYIARVQPVTMIWLKPGPPPR